MFMVSLNILELCVDLYWYIDLLDDKFIVVVYFMFGVYMEQQENDLIIGYSVEGVFMYVSVARREFKVCVEVVDRGEYIIFDEFKKELEKWLKGKEDIEQLQCLR